MYSKVRKYKILIAFALLLTSVIFAAQEPHTYCKNCVPDPNGDWVYEECKPGKYGSYQSGWSYCDFVIENGVRNCYYGGTFYSQTECM